LAFDRQGIVPVVPPSMAVDKVRSIFDALERTYVCLTDAYVVSFTRVRGRSQWLPVASRVE
jgi:hypothetical protein